MEKQANTLEGEALQYEALPLPKLPAASIAISVDPEMLEDRFIYLMISDGIQNAVDLHIRAMICIELASPVVILGAGPIQ